MEISLLNYIWQGGWLAIGAFLIYFIIKLEKRIEKIENSIIQFHCDYVKKNEYFRDVSGWRGEINRLEDKIDNMMLMFLKEKDK